MIGRILEDKREIKDLLMSEGECQFQFRVGDPDRWAKTPGDVIVKIIPYRECGDCDCEIWFEAIRANGRIDRLNGKYAFQISYAAEGKTP